MLILMDENETSKMLKVSIQTLRNWRAKEKGPAYYRIGRSIRYKKKDVEAYLERRFIQTSFKPLDTKMKRSLISKARAVLKDKLVKLYKMDRQA